MEGSFVLFLAAVAAVVIVSALWAAENKRRTALEATARRLGLSFDPSPDSRLHHEYRHSVFREVHSGKATNNLWGVMTLAGYPVQVRMGDYRYVTRQGEHKQTYQISYAVFHPPFRGIPDLLLRREHLGDKVLSGIGFDDIDFESEEFSRTFWVKSENKKFAYDLIHPKMMDFLLQGPTPHVEMVNDVCLILEGRGRWDPDTFEGAPGWFQAFLALWPEHLIERLNPGQGRSL